MYGIIDKPLNALRSGWVAAMKLTLKHDYVDPDSDLEHKMLDNRCSLLLGCVEGLGFQCHGIVLLNGCMEGGLAFRVFLPGVSLEFALA